MSYLRTISISMLAAALFMTTACGGESEPQDQVFKLDVRGGELAPDGDALRVNQGDTVTLTISSDQHGRFHLHGYDIEVSAGPGEPGEITLDAGATGSFPITFHLGEGEEESTHEEGEGDKKDEDSAHAEGEEGEEMSLGALEVLPR